MKILFVTRGYPSEKDPMAGNYEAVQARAIAAKGHEVSVIGIKWRNLIHLMECRPVNHRVDNGIDVYTCMRVTPFTLKVTIPKVNLAVRKWAFKQIFKKYLKEKGLPDVIHIHSLHAAPAILAVKELCDVPIVITEHWSKILSKEMPDGIKRDIECWGRECYPLADQIVAVSNSLAMTISNRFNLDCCVISNMVENRFFNTAANKPIHQGFRFVSVGSLFPIKGYDSLIEAFSKLDDNLDVSLDIVGRGTETENLQRLINGRRQQKRIRLVGVMPPEEVSRMLENSDCFVLASHSETFGIAFIEAMAKGLPLIATRCGGPEDIVNNENGILVDIGDIDGLTEAMDFMINHKEDFDKDKIRKYCYDNYSEGVITDKIINVYKDVIKKRS